MFLLTGGTRERLSRVDTTGVASIPGGFLCARQAEGIAELTRLRGRTAQRIRITDQSLDLHDVLWSDGLLYVVCTQINTILELDAETFVEVRSWNFADEPDSQHINSVCVHDGRILASRFGRFTTHRGYKGSTRGAGEIFDVETDETVVGGLSQPHSLTSYGSELWVCDSEAHTLRRYRGASEEGAYPLGGYVRGLALGKTEVYVGLSQSRNDPGTASGLAAILVLDRDSMSGTARIELPVAEIYDIRRVTGIGTDSLRASALADASAEFDVLAHSRNLARIAAHESEVLAIASRHEVDVAEERLAEVQRTLAETRSDDAVRFAKIATDLADAVSRTQGLALTLEEERLWSVRLVASSRELVAALETRDRRIEAQLASLDALHEFARSVTDSRVWRYSRRLGMLPVVDPVVRLPVDAVRTIPQVPSRGDLPVLRLKFEELEAPTVSIIVTSHGNFDATLACIQSIHAARDITTFELILIEDASGDIEMDRFRSIPGLRYQRNDSNLGFLRSANQAKDLARGHYVHFLNNDTVVVSGWLDALVSTFSKFEDCGLAGSLLAYPDGRLQEAGGIIWSDADGCNHGRGDEADAQRYAYVHRADYVSGASILLPSALFRSMGGFDEQFAPAYYEDTDLAFRVRERGLQVYVQPASRVTHYEGLSHGTDDSVGPKAHQVTNRAKFLARWAETLHRDQLAPGTHIFLAKNRSQRTKSVLIVDRHAPRPDQDAGSRAIWQLLRVLHLRGFNLKFWSCADSPDEPAYLNNLQAHGIEVVSEAGGPTFSAWIAANGQYIDYAILSRPLVSEAVLPEVRRHTSAKVIYYGHDVHFQRIDRQFELTGEFGLDSHARHLQRVEEGLWSAADLVLYPSSEEAALVEEHLSTASSDSRVAAIPLFAYEACADRTDTDDETLAARRDVVFVGGFGHAPNEDAVVWFAEHVWPLVAQSVARARLVLVGSDPGPRVLDLSADDVVVAGRVDEDALVAHYQDAIIAVAPLRFGAGVKGKVLEAMRFGVPCVTTRIGAQGLEGAHFLRVADSPDAIASHMIELMTDSHAWRAASSLGQQFIRERYSVDAVWGVLGSIMDQLPYPSVDSRLARLAQVNHHRPHSALGYRPPVSRLVRNNVSDLNS